MATRRRIKASDMGGGALDVATSILQQIDELSTRTEYLEQDHKYMWKAIEPMQKAIEELGKTTKALKQYITDHNELHRNMSQATGSSQRDLIKLVRNVIAQTDIVQSAVKDLVRNREIPVILDVKAPDVNIDVPIASSYPPERGSWEFNVKRASNGVIAKVIANPK